MGFLPRNASGQKITWWFFAGTMAIILATRAGNTISVMLRTEEIKCLCFGWTMKIRRRELLKTHNVSARFMHNDILRAAGLNDEGKTLMEEREDNLPMLESFWYDNEGHTLPKYMATLDASST